MGNVDLLMGSVYVKEIVKMEYLTIKITYTEWINLHLH